MAYARTMTALVVSPPGGGWVDHIVWGAPDTAAAAEALADRTGVQAQPASTPRDSSYPTSSRGLALGGERFLEVYGPNPDYDGGPHAMHDMLANLPEPRLLVWFARVADLAAAGAALAAAGTPLTPMLDEWARTDAASFRNGYLTDHLFDPSVPFLIQWRDRLDMDERMAGGLDLVDLTVVASDPDRTAAVHTTLGLTVPIEPGPADGFRITLDTPKGQVTL